MTSEITIPILPCHAIQEMLAFYRVLGFEITYQQARPNTYACVKRGGIELHFFTLKGYKPENSYSTCIVSVNDVDALYQQFVDALCQHYGRLPIAGIPRVTKLRNHSSGRGFNVIDPGGNWIRISQPIQAGSAEAPPPDELSKLARVLRAADLLADSNGDFATAARMIDNALLQEVNVPAAHRAQALIAWAALAINMGDALRARSLLLELRQIPLDARDRAALTADFARAADLEAMLANAQHSIVPPDDKGLMTGGGIS